MNGDAGLTLENILARLQSTEEAVAKAIASLLDENFAFFLTNIDRDEVEPVMFLFIIQKMTKSEILRDFLVKFLILKTSIEGKRAEMIGNIALGTTLFGKTTQGGKVKPPSLTL